MEMEIVVKVVMEMKIVVEVAAEVVAF